MSGLSASAPVGQAPTQARHSVQPAVSTTTAPKGAPAGSAISSAWVGADFLPMGKKRAVMRLALDALHRAGAREIGLKQGADGGTVSLADGTRIALPGHRIVPVDTTGAGDAFNAGYLCAHLSGQTHRDKLALANACGAVTALSRGGTGGLNGLADATGMLERGTAAG